MTSQLKMTEMLLARHYSDHVFFATVAGVDRGPGVPALGVPGGLMVRRAGDGDDTAAMGPCAYSPSLPTVTVERDHWNIEDDPELDPIRVTYLDLELGDLVKVEKLGAVYFVEYKVMTTGAAVLPAPAP